MKKKDTISLNNVPPWLLIHVDGGTSDKRDFRFSRGFRIGREKSSDIQVNDPHVSRSHLAFEFKQGDWWLRDVGSANGTYDDGSESLSSYAKNTIQMVSNRSHKRSLFVS